MDNLCGVSGGMAQNLKSGWSCRRIRSALVTRKPSCVHPGYRRTVRKVFVSCSTENDVCHRCALQH